MGAASQKNRKKPSDYLTLIPLISVIAIVPLVFRLYRYDTGLSGYDYYAADGISHCMERWCCLRYFLL